MPVYHPDHVEYHTTSGHIRIALEDGSLLPAYWSHPDTGGRFPGVVLIHDWWGITETERHLANLFAQAGCYVIVPDLFEGRLASTPQEAMALVEQFGARGYPRVDAALQALETHLRCNRSVAAVGLGMGGTFAFEAALARPDLEAAVAYYGFPQRFFGRFPEARAPILAVYGSLEPHVPADVRDRLRAELAESPLDHRLVVLQGASRDFFTPGQTETTHEYARAALRETLDFLDAHLEGPSRPPEKKAL